MLTDPPSYTFFFAMASIDPATQLKAPVALALALAPAGVVGPQVPGAATNEKCCISTIKIKLVAITKRDWESICRRHNAEIFCTHLPKF